MAGQPRYYIAVTAIVATKNEEVAISRCLSALRDFDEVVVVDSGSVDKTVAIARQWGARIVSFVWDGRYPKKRQWCLDRLDLRNDWVMFVDADEVAKATSVPGLMMPGAVWVRPRKVAVWAAVPVVVTTSDWA